MVKYFIIITIFISSCSINRRDREDKIYQSNNSKLYQDLKLTNKLDSVLKINNIEKIDSVNFHRMLNSNRINFIYYAYPYCGPTFDLIDSCIILGKKHNEEFNPIFIIDSTFFDLHKIQQFKERGLTKIYLQNNNFNYQGFLSKHYDLKVIRLIYLIRNDSILYSGSNINTEIIKSISKNKDK